MIIIYSDAIISPFGTGFMYVAGTSHVNHVLSKVVFSPEIFKKLNKHHIPLAAIIINYFVGLLLFLPFPDWQSMVSSIFYWYWNYFLFRVIWSWH